MMSPTGTSFFLHSNSEQATDENAAQSRDAHHASHSSPLHPPPDLATSGETRQTCGLRVKAGRR